MTTKERIHELVDRLPGESEEHAEAYLRYLLQTSDPVLAALQSAPVDDEPETDEERGAVEEGREAWRRGEVVTDEELRHELHL